MTQPKERYNCGGHALQTKTWYRPYENEKYGYDIWDYIGDMEEAGLGEEEILKYLTDADIDCILDDFPNLEVVDYDKIDYARKVIAYRIMYRQCIVGDYDFHFKYWNGKTWSEKMGRGMIRHCELLPNDEWDYGLFGNCYNGEIVYFQPKRV